MRVQMFLPRAAKVATIGNIFVVEFFLGERFIIGKQVFKSLFFCFQFYFTTEESHEDFRGKNRKRREDISRKYR